MDNEILRFESDLAATLETLELPHDRAHTLLFKAGGNLSNRELGQILKNLRDDSDGLYQVIDTIIAESDRIMAEGDLLPRGTK